MQWPRLKRFGVSWKLISFFTLSIAVLSLSQNCAQSFDIETIPSRTQLSLNQPQVSDIIFSKFQVNEGQVFSNKNSMTVFLEAQNAIEMAIFNSERCEGEPQWEPFKIYSERDLQKNSKNYFSAKVRVSPQVESGCLSAFVVHDNIAPVLSLPEPVPEKTFQAQTSFRLNVNELGSGLNQMFCEGVPSLCNSSTVTIANSINGHKSLIVKAIDFAGNMSAPMNITYLFDNTAPELILSRVPPERSGSGSAVVEFSANDNLSSIVRFECTLDSNQMVSCINKFEVTDLVVGAHQLSIVAIDETGNRSVPKKVNWTVVKNLPTIRITQSPQPFTNVYSAIKFDGSDQFSAALNFFECRFNNGSWNPCASPLQLSEQNVRSGSNTFELRGQDKDGLYSGIEKLVWTYDTLAPVISFSQKPGEFTNSSLIPIAITMDQVEDLDFIEYKLDGAVYYKGKELSFSKASVSEGPHSISIRAVDKSGNASNQLTVVFTIDVQAPVIEFFRRIVSVGAVSIEFKASDAGSGLKTTQCSVNDGAFSDCISPLIVENSVDGNNKIQLKVTDKATNVTTNSINYFYQEPLEIRNVKVDFGTSCGVTKKGIVCWMSPSGMNNVVPTSSVSGITDFAMLNDGNWTNSFCEIINSGLRCMGTNKKGQLGLGHFTDTTAMQVVPGFESGVTRITGQGTESYPCAIKNGSVYCWGKNNPTPKLIPFIQNAIDVQSGGMGACARNNAGLVKCWSVGYTGNAVETVIAGLPQSTTMFAHGHYHACVISRGELWCWGANQGKRRSGFVSKPPDR